jgi:glycine/D-amino acid oxidase-like deaminating enzyme
MPSVVIVGAGIMGLCSAWALSRRGHVVTMIEQGPIPNPLGSSYDEHRIIRHAYGAMHGYARLMPDAFAAWHLLWTDLGHDQLEALPATYCLRMTSEWYDDVSASLSALDIPYRDIPLDTVAANLPMLRRDGLLRVVETQGAGLLFARRIVDDLVRYLPTRGVELVPHTAIDAVDAERAIVRSGSRSWSGDRLLIAAGAWLPRLLGGLPEEPRPSLQTVVYLEPPSYLAAVWRVAPLLLNRLPTRSGGVYILPPRRGTRLKLGDYSHNFEGDPRAPRQADSKHVERVLEAGGLALADFDRYRLIEAKACFYTATRDERFALRPLGARGWLLSACSGHGFKLAALMGLGAADAIEGTRPAGEVALWAAGRIGDRRPVRAPA